MSAAPEPPQGEASAPTEPPRFEAPESSPSKSSAEPAPDWRTTVLPWLRRPVNPAAAASVSSSLPRTWRLALLALLCAVAAVALLWPLAAARWWPQGAGAQAAPPLAAASAALAAMPLAPGTRIRDCADEARCPWLRVLPPGQLLMGSAPAEAGRHDDEGPQHRVTIAYPLAVAEAEVTREQFAAFVAASGHQVPPGCNVWSGSKWDFDKSRSWQSPGFEQTGQHPVACVAWDDAQAYVQWLSKATGQTYRLLSEAEWQYAARAGAASRYSFGDRSEDLCLHANVADRDAKAKFPTATLAECSDGFVYTAPVKSKLPNAWGLYDLHGNVWEWVSDCWHSTYLQAPSDGSAWQADCTDGSRVLRGGGWGNDPDLARSAFRGRDAPGDRDISTGFRVARTLAPSSFTPLPPAEAASQ